jgi:hypothetical protein
MHTRDRRLDIYKKGATLLPMKQTRSTVGKGLNLSTRVINQRKGKGAYVRKNRYNRYE